MNCTADQLIEGAQAILDLLAAAPNRVESCETLLNRARVHANLSAQAIQESMDFLVRMNLVEFRRA